MPDIWGLAAIVTKFALYLGILTATGTVMTALVFQLERFRAFALTFGVIGLCAAQLSYSLRGANLTGDASGMTDPEMLGLLWSTPVGTALMLRLGGLVLLIIGLFMGRAGLWLSMLGGILAIWSFGYVGHIPAQDDVLLTMALTLHLIAIAFWIGILTPLRRLTANPATWSQAADIGHRFGTIASITVPALIIVGAVMSYTLVGSVSILLASSYGQALIVKVILVAGLLGLAAANKLRFIPGLQAGDSHAANHLSKSIVVEWLVILAVLGVNAVLTSNLTLPQ